MRHLSTHKKGSFTLTPLCAALSCRVEVLAYLSLRTFMEILPMKSNRSLLVMSILFFVFAAAFSVVFWEDVSMAAKIGLFVLGFGSGVAAGQWLAGRSV